MGSKNFVSLNLPAETLVSESYAITQNAFLRRREKGADSDACADSAYFGPAAGGTDADKQ